MRARAFALLLATLALAACGEEPEVPDVRGMEVSEAVHALAAREVAWSGFGDPPYPRQPDRIVLGQRPAPGTAAGDDTAVALELAPVLDASSDRRPSRSSA